MMIANIFLQQTYAYTIQLYQVVSVYQNRSIAQQQVRHMARIFSMYSFYLAYFVNKQGSLISVFRCKKFPFTNHHFNALISNKRCIITDAIQELF